MRRSKQVDRSDLTTPCLRLQVDAPPSGLLLLALVLVLVLVLLPLSLRSCRCCRSGGGPRRTPDSSAGRRRRRGNPFGTPEHVQPGHEPPRSRRPPAPAV